jgi:hypothetical protein
VLTVTSGDTSVLTHAREVVLLYCTVEARPFSPLRAVPVSIPIDEPVRLLHPDQPGGRVPKSLLSKASLSQGELVGVMRDSRVSMVSLVRRGEVGMVS